MKIKYTWTSFQKDCENISSKINKDFNCIVGITRGGIFLAGMISEITDNKNVYTIGYESYKDDKKGNIKKTISLNKDLRNKKILLCDDIADTGETLLNSINDLIKLNNKIITLTLHYKPQSKIVPDIYEHKTEDWIVYPWEYEN